MGHVFDYKSKTFWARKDLAVTVLNRMDTLADDLIADIENSPAGYVGVDGDEQWAAEIRRLARLRGAVRGKYLKRYRAGTNLALLAPDVRAAFPTDDAVALRSVMQAQENG